MPQRRIRLAQGRVVDPSQGVDQVADLVIEGNRVLGLDAPAAAEEEVVDVSGKVVVPGLVDLYAELREPGYEEDETIATGVEAALAGGFTSLAAAPNTQPPVDTQAAVEFLQHQAARAGGARVWPVACASRGAAGEELAEIGQLVQAGAMAFSDADRPIRDPGLMRRVFQYCGMFQRPVFSFPEVPELAQGVMHEGTVSMILGLKAIPAAAEVVAVSRDVTLAEATGGRLHLTHISTAGAIEVLRRAKARGVQVTASITPFHLALTDEALRSFDSRFKIRPPLRSREDVEACLQAVADGTIDAICSGHSPRCEEKKVQDLDLAPFGAVSLETTLAAVITYLIRPGHLDWLTAVERLSTAPARILGIPAGTLTPGSPADVTIIDPEVRWVVRPEQFRSRSRSCPFAGQKLWGQVAGVLVDGQWKLKRLE